MQITLRDIAQRSGVSITTVSRALHGTYPVAQETQERINEAIAALNYTPKKIPPRALHHKNNRDHTTPPGARTGCIGLILGDVGRKFSDPFWSCVLDGVSEETRRQHYHLRFTFTYGDLEHGYQRRLVSLEHIDGLLLMGHHEPMIAGIDPAYIVAIERHWEVPMRIDNIMIEKRYTMYALIDHLVEQGYRHFRFLSGLFADDRTAAFMEALTRHQIPLPQDFYVETSWVMEEAYQMIFAWLKTAATLPDVLVCASDVIAIAALRAAEACQIRVPEDLAITGFDDIPFASDLHPPLTTIHVPKEQLGSIAVRRLIERINTPDQLPLIQMVPTYPVIRRSSTRK